MTRRVSVENGKYTMVENLGYKIDILRYGEPWITDITGSKALGTMMSELDAARVVLQAARNWRTAMSGPMHEQADADQALCAALELHDQLVDDREPPSAWAAIP